jgi:hypothetical protein
MVFGGNGGSGGSWNKPRYHGSILNSTYHNTPNPGPRGLPRGTICNLIDDRSPISLNSCKCKVQQKQWCSITRSACRLGFCWGLNLDRRLRDMYRNLGIWESGVVPYNGGWGWFVAVHWFWNLVPQSSQLFLLQFLMGGHRQATAQEMPVPTGIHQSPVCVWAGNLFQIFAHFVQITINLVPRIQ